MPALFALILLLLASAAYGSVYKCSIEKGTVVYQDTPCGPGKELRNLDTDPPNLSVVPGTPLPAARAAPPVRADRPIKIGVRQAKQASKRGSAAERKFISVGTAEAEVIAKIGRPDVSSRGHGKVDRRWSYMPAAGDPNTLTTLTLVGGKVASVERKVVR